MLESRIILLQLILLPIIVLSSPYEYKIPNVAFPNLKGKEFKPPTPREAGADGESIDSREDDDVKTWRIDQMPLHTFRPEEYLLTDEEIEELDKSTDVKVSKEAWKLFNQNADVFIIDSKTTKDSYKVFAFRRAVINTKLLEEVTGVKNETWTIDVFEDYQSVTYCDSEKINHSFDKVFIFRDEVHYAKFSYICSEKNPKQVCMMSTIYDEPDTTQGWANEDLKEMKLRTMDGGNRVRVKTWRHFRTCEKGNFVQRLYPTLSQRLDSVGLTKLDTRFSENRNIMLALKLFGQQILHTFRKEIPDFPEDELADLEQTDRVLMKEVYYHPVLEPDQEIVDDIIE